MTGHDAQSSSRNPGRRAGRDVGQTCANGGVTTANPGWSWPPWLLDPMSSNTQRVPLGGLPVGWGYKATLTELRQLELHSQPLNEAERD